MSNQFRTLCTELVDMWDEVTQKPVSYTQRHKTFCAKVEWVVSAARAALAEPEPEPPWQPIDTAPKDGTEILASDYDAIEIVSWAAPRFNLIPGDWVNRDSHVMFPAWWQPLADHPPMPTIESD